MPVTPHGVEIGGPPLKVSEGLDLAMAGSLVQKKVSPPSAGTFPVSGGTFVVLLLGTVLLIGALNFVPALTLGPIVEHFQTFQGKLY